MSISERENERKTVRSRLWPESKNIVKSKKKKKKGYVVH